LAGIMKYYPAERLQILGKIIMETGRMI